MDRLDVNSLYGGGNPKQSKQSKPEKKVTTYSPKDIDPETETSMSKLFKVNRDLQREVDTLKEQSKEQSKKDNLLIKKLESVIKAHNIQF